MRGEEDTYKHAPETVGDAHCGDLRRLPLRRLSFVEFGVPLGEERLGYRAYVVDVCTRNLSGIGDGGGGMGTYTLNRSRSLRP